jgi:hypothetical protein
MHYDGPDVVTAIVTLIKYRREKTEQARINDLKTYVSPPYKSTDSVEQTPATRENNQPDTTNKSILWQTKEDFQYSQESYPTDNPSLG